MKSTEMFEILRDYYLDKKLEYLSTGQITLEGWELKFIEKIKEEKLNG